MHRHWVARLATSIISALCLLLFLPTTVSAQNTQPITDETLQYDIIYQWGILWIKAADGTLSIRRNGDNYHAQVTATTTPFADGIMKVRDTLTTIMQVSNLKPLNYNQISREGKYHQINNVQFIYCNDSTIGKTHIVRPGKDYDKTFTIGKQGEVYDMISIFYRIRNLPFETMQTGNIIKTYIFSGKQIETLEIEYQGIKEIEIDDTKHQAHYIRFFFYNENGSKKSDKISAWISTTDFIPLQLEGKLPIGSMKVRLSDRK